VQRRALLILLGGIVYALGWRSVTRQRPYRAVLGHLSAAIDLTLVMALTLNWSIFPGGEVIPTQAKFAIGWGALFVALALTALRFDWRMVLAVTFEAAGAYGLYVAFLARFSAVRFATRTEQSFDAMTLNSVDIGGRIALLLPRCRVRRGRGMRGRERCWRARRRRWAMSPA